jgi:hypothetical protein
MTAHLPVLAAFLCACLLGARFFLYLTRPDREPDAEPLVPALPVDRYIQQLRDAKRKAALREATRVLDRVRSGAHRV